MHVKPTSKNARATVNRLLESPRYFPGPVTYMAAERFRPITLRNLSDYEVLRDDGEFTYALHPEHLSACAFLNHDAARKPRLGVVPVLTVSLRDSGIRGYRQAYHLRIQKAQSMRGVATRLYLALVDRFGGIVSDFEHLEGGQRLWRSFVETAARRGLRITVVNTETGAEEPVDAQTPDAHIWSLDRSKQPVVLVLAKADGRESHGR